MTETPAVLVTWHPDIFLHDLSVAHVAMDQNRIATIQASISSLAASGRVHLQLANPATQEQFTRVHEPEYLESLADTANLAAGELFAFDRETRLSKHTWRALQLSAGGACQAVDAVMAGRAFHAFNVAYAGHHAQASHASGFCFTNPVAIAALHARAQGVERVAVLDIDTHSGNGTILTLLSHPEILFAETYQRGYPGSFLPGVRPEHILREKCNQIREFGYGWTRLLDKVAAFNPQLVLVSAGFDAHRADPLNIPGLADDHYVWIAEKIASLGAPVVATLEGGYSVPDTARCAALFVDRLSASVNTR